MVRLIFYASMITIVARVAGPQAPDTSRSIRVSTVLVGPVTNNRIAVEMIRQNIAISSESPRTVTGYPLDAPDIVIRANIVEEGGGSVVVLSAVAVTNGAPPAAPVYAVDRGTHRGGRVLTRFMELVTGLPSTVRLL